MGGWDTAGGGKTRWQGRRVWPVPKRCLRADRHGNRWWDFDRLMPGEDFWDTLDLVDAGRRGRGRGATTGADGTDEGGSEGATTGADGTDGTDGTGGGEGEDGDGGEGEG